MKTSKYTKGRAIKTLGDLRRSKSNWFMSAYGRVIHRTVLNNRNFGQVAYMIARGQLFEAIRPKGHPYTFHITYAGHSPELHPSDCYELRCREVNVRQVIGNLSLAHAKITAIAQLRALGIKDKTIAVNICFHDDALKVASPIWPSTAAQPPF